MLQQDMVVPPAKASPPASPLAGPLNSHVASSGSSRLVGPLNSRLQSEQSGGLAPRTLSSVWRYVDKDFQNWRRSRRLNQKESLV